MYSYIIHNKGMSQLMNLSFRCSSRGILSGIVLYRAVARSVHDHCHEGMWSFEDGTINEGTTEKFSLVA